MSIQNYFGFAVFFFFVVILSCQSNTPAKPILIGGFINGTQQIELFFDRPLSDLPKAKHFQISSASGMEIKIQETGFGKTPEILGLSLRDTVNIKDEYTVVFEGLSKRLVWNRIYQEPEFVNLNAELGATYSPTFTTFRLYAPRAKTVTVNIYENPIPTANEETEKINLIEQSGGVWEVVVQKNLDGKYYTFQLVSQAPDCHPDLEVVDPYARIVTRGDGNSMVKKDLFSQTQGRGMIVNPAQTGSVVEAPRDNFDISQAIIYEMHVRDFTRDANSGVSEPLKGLYLGAAQTGTRCKSLKTCLDHVKELGVTVVQLLPVNEFWVADEKQFKNRFIDYKAEKKQWHQKEYYNWGYAPINYFSVEGWYATNPDDLSRIREFKQMISTFHQNGIRVTLDVVFNHTFEGSRDNFAHWLFRGIDTDCYYRCQPDGQFFNGIFCGNEVNTQNPMVAKYILDCLKYWVTEFKVDGFRFDWMSALDPVTMNQMVRELRQLNPNILLYGELWTLRNLSFQGKNTSTYVDRQHVGAFERDFDLPAGSIAGFNDYFRDAVKGSGYQRDYAGGFIQNITEEIYYQHRSHELLRQVVKGMVDFQTRSGDSTEWRDTRSPLNSLNYISCHDGFTLFDKLLIAEYCEYREPGQSDSPKFNYPRSPENPEVVDFNDSTQFKDPVAELKLKKMAKLGAAILLTSQGIPFVHAGMEMLRQKIKLMPSNDSPTGEFYEFDSNSNTSPDAVNAIQWALKEKNLDMFHYVQGLIKLRRQHPTFRRTTAEQVRCGLFLRDEWLPTESDACVAYQLLDESGELNQEAWKNVVVLMNPYQNPRIFKIPAGNWKLVVNHQKAGVDVISTQKGGELKVEGISLNVLYQ